MRDSRHECQHLLVGEFGSGTEHMDKKDIKVFGTTDPLDK